MWIIKLIIYIYINLNNETTSSGTAQVQILFRGGGRGGRGGGKWGVVGPGAGLGRRGEGRLTC